MSDKMDGVAEGPDSPDARLTLKGGVVKGGGSYSGPAPGSDNQFVYNMTNRKRGLFVLINNKSFYRETQMGERSGTDVDATNLYHRFKALDFEVHLFNNQTVAQMLTIMQDASKYNHADADCFACAILSHGDEGVVYGIDGIVKIDELFAPIKGANCPSLIGKPKLFFIQACRGNQLDHGVEVADADSETVETKIYRIPQEADILYAYSTVPGYFSWRNSSKGSWFVQALSRVLEEYGDSKEIMWMLTRTNHITAYEFQSNASKEFMNKKKQVSQIVSMLTKELYFTPKKKDTGTAV